MIYQVDLTRLYDRSLQTWPGDPPVMDCSKVATGSSFGVLDPVKKKKSFSEKMINQVPQKNICLLWKQKLMTKKIHDS